MTADFKEGHRGGGSANRLADEHVDVDMALSETMYVPRHLRLLAVKAELKERAKPRRDMTEAVARLFGVTGRMLRYRAGRYLAEGVEGLRARGGQGRKRDISREDRAKAVRDSVESSMGEGGGGGGGEKPTCRACLAEDADEGGASRREGERRARPKKCKCRAGAPFPASAGAGGGERASASAAAPSSTRRRARYTAPAARARGPGRVELRGPPPCAILYTPGTARCTTCAMCTRSNESGATHRRISKSASSRAPAGAARPWAWRQDGRIEPYRKGGCRTGVYGVAFAGMDGATGRTWIEGGKKAALPSGRSRQATAVHGTWFSDGPRFVREHKHACSCALIGFLKGASAKCGRWSCTRTGRPSTAPRTPGGSCATPAGGSPAGTFAPSCFRPARRS